MKTCNMCGRVPADATDELTWSGATERGRATWTCPECVRRNLRSVEAKLESEWW